jgi:Mrp family chromosome partitioning ATPase
MSSISVNDKRASRKVGRVVEGDAAGHYQELLHRLSEYQASNGRRLPLLGIVACQRGDGASTVAAHFACAAAKQAARRVLLVDADFTSPSLHHTFGLRQGPGLAEALDQPHEAHNWIQPTDSENLRILTAGCVTPGTEFDDERVSAFFEVVRPEFDWVLFDLPAGLAGHGAIGLARLLDGVILAVQAERTRRDAARELREFADRARVNLLGAILSARHP